MDFKRKHKQQKKQIKKFINEIKNKSSCEHCEEDHPATLEFHHVDPEEKDFTISSAVRLGWSIQKIKAELKKCTILCANCHRKLHWNEKNDLNN